MIPTNVRESQVVKKPIFNLNNLSKVKANNKTNNTNRNNITNNNKTKTNNTNNRNKNVNYRNKTNDNNSSNTNNNKSFNNSMNRIISTVKSSFQTQPWFTFNHVSGQAKTSEVVSNFLNNNSVKFEGNALEGTNSSSFGSIHELVAANNNKQKYVMKIFRLYDMHDFNTLKTEARVGSQNDAALWGTKIHCHTLFNVTTNKFIKIESVQRASFEQSSYLSKNELVGLYIMDHVLQGQQNNQFLSLKKFKKNFIKNNNSELRDQLVQELKKCLKRFYKIPKIHGDLHDSNIMVVFHRAPQNNKIVIKRLTIIDYGTVFIVPKIAKIWSEKDSLSTIYKKMHNFLEKNSHPFMTKTNDVYPLNTNIYLYNVKGGGQQLRSNKKLLDLYVKNMLSNAIKMNSGKSSKKSQTVTVQKVSKASSGFIDSVASLFGLGGSTKKTTKVKAKSAPAALSNPIKCGDCKCYKTSLVSKGPKGGKFYISKGKKVYCNQSQQHSKVKKCKKQCEQKSKSSKKSTAQTIMHVPSKENNKIILGTDNL